MSDDIETQIKKAEFEIARYRSTIAQLKLDILHIESNLIEQQILKDVLQEQLRRITIALVPSKDEKENMESARFAEAYENIKNKI